MAQAGKPVRIGMHHVEFVATAQVFVLVSFGKHIISMQNGRLNDQVRTCLIQRYGVCDASMPRSGMMAASLWFQQSHSGDTFMMKLMWKCGLSFSTAAEYSAIL